MLSSHQFKPVRGKQLSMFMTPREVVRTYSPSLGEMGDMSPQSFWAMKAAEARQSGLTDSVRQGGVHTPIQVMTTGEFPGERPQVVEGHHRTMAGYETGRDTQLMPVAHYEPDDIEGVLSDFDRWNPPRRS